MPKYKLWTLEYVCIVLVSIRLLLLFIKLIKIDNYYQIVLSLQITCLLTSENIVACVEYNSIVIIIYKIHQNRQLLPNCGIFTNTLLTSEKNVASIEYNSIVIIVYTIHQNQQLLPNCGIFTNNLLTSENNVICCINTILHCIVTLNCCEYVNINVFNCNVWTCK